MSGNLEVVDFDLEAEAFGEWAQRVHEQDDSLLSRLIIEKSPHGVHVAYRCREATIGGNTKLARRGIEVSGPGEHPYKSKTFQAQKIGGKWFIVFEVIETRGQGGYCLIHPSKGYEAKQGDFRTVPTISAAEREILIESARACNTWTPPQDIQRGYNQRQSTSSEGRLPGADFDERGDVRALLEKHGWTSKGFGNDRQREKWARPGKERGKENSATLTDGKILYCFSSNAHPFESGRAYGPFAVFATLEHGGDFSAASKALSAQGYGTARAQSQSRFQSQNSAPSMADLREYVDFSLVPGQKVTADEICRGLSCYGREERKAVYTYLGRLCKEGILRKDDYKYGGFRRVIEIDEYDLSGEIGQDDILFKIKLPLDLDGLLKIKPNQLVQVSGRYDAGKSSFLFQVEANNYQDNKIVHIISDEWSLCAIKERMDILGIPRPHPNIKVMLMKPGYEEMIPSGRCIVLIDYIRGDQNPFETDAQIQRVLKNLRGGIAIFATQKHPGLDRPVGGQFAVHASHHIVMLDRWKDVYTCKIYRSKSERNLEGLFRTFKFDQRKRLYPCMDTWKQGEIKWEKEPKPQTGNDNNDNNDNKSAVVNRGGPRIDKERKKESSKEKKKEETPEAQSLPFNQSPSKMQASPHSSFTEKASIRADKEDSEADPGPDYMVVVV